MIDHAATLWEAIADAIGDAPALQHGATVTSWTSFDERSARLATALSRAGIGVGAKVAIDLYNCSEYLECVFAALKTRAAFCNVNYRYLDNELVHLLSDSDAEAVIFHTSLGVRLFSAIHRVPAMKIMIAIDDAGTGTPDGAVDYDEIMATMPLAPRITRDRDDRFLSYTGGTTGLPKGVEYVVGLMTTRTLSYRPLLSGLDGFTDDPVADAVRLRNEGRSPVTIPASPLMHSTGLTMVSYPALTCGGTVVTLEPRRFDANTLLQTVERTRATVIGIVGDAIARPMLNALRSAAAAGTPYDVSSVRNILSAGVAWSAEVKDGLFEFLPDALLADNCGASEGVHYGTAITRRGDVNSTARFTAAESVVVLDDDGQVMERGNGEIGLLAAVSTCSGYYNDPITTAANYRNINGVLHGVPGDLGSIDADGFLTLIGRGSSCINTGGEKVYPEEVEHVIREIAGVEDALVVGLPDERFGQQVVAVVELLDGSALSEPDVIAAVRGQLADYKAPKRICFVPAVPRHANGKPDYPTAKELALTGTGR